MHVLFYTITGYVKHLLPQSSNLVLKEESMQCKALEGKFYFKANVIFYAFYFLLMHFVNSKQNILFCKIYIFANLSRSISEIYNLAKISCKYYRLFLSLFVIFEMRQAR